MRRSSMAVPTRSTRPALAPRPRRTSCTSSRRAKAGACACGSSRRARCPTTPLATTTPPSWSCAAPNRTRFYQLRIQYPPESEQFRIIRQAHAACSGPNNSTTTRLSAGSRATRPSRLRPSSARSGVATGTGRTSSTATSSPCPTRGNTRGSPRGTFRFTPSSSRASTRPSPSRRSRSCSANGTCTRTARCLPTSSPSPT